MHQLVAGFGFVVRNFQGGDVVIRKLGILLAVVLVMSGNALAEPYSFTVKSRSTIGPSGQDAIETVAQIKEVLLDGNAPSMVVLDNNGKEAKLTLGERVNLLFVKKHCLPGNYMRIILVPATDTIYKLRGMCKEPRSHQRQETKTFLLN